MSTDQQQGRPSEEGNGEQEREQFVKDFEKLGVTMTFTWDKDEGKYKIIANKDVENFPLIEHEDYKVAIGHFNRAYKSYVDNARISNLGSKIGPPIPTTSRRRTRQDEFAEGINILRGSSAVADVEPKGRGPAGEGSSGLGNSTRQEDYGNLSKGAHRGV